MKMKKMNRKSLKTKEKFDSWCGRESTLTVFLLQTKLLSKFLYFLLYLFTMYISRSLKIYLPRRFVSIHKSQVSYMMLKNRNNTCRRYTKGWLYCLQFIFMRIVSLMFSFNMLNFGFWNLLKLQVEQRWWEL